MGEKLREETLFRTPPGLLSEVVPYKGGVVTVSVNTDRLKQDFLEEVLSRPNLDTEKAEDIAGRVKFFTNNRQLYEHVYGDMKRKGIESKLWRVLGPVIKPSLALLDILSMKDLAGATYPVDPAPALFLNLNTIISWASTQTKNRREVVEASIIQGVHQTWRHEREHLLRLVDAKARKEDRKTSKIQLVAGVTVAGLISLGSICFIPRELGGDPRIDTLSMLRLLVTPAFSVLGSQLITDGLWYYLWNSAEKEANLQSKSGSNLPGLFDFKFESS